MYIHVYTYMCIYIYVCIYVCIYVHIYIYLYTYIHVYISGPRRINQPFIHVQYHIQIHYHTACNIIPYTSTLCRYLPHAQDSLEFVNHIVYHIYNTTRIYNTACNIIPPINVLCIYSSHVQDLLALLIKPNDTNTMLHINTPYDAAYNSKRGGYDYRSLLQNIVSL